MKNDRRAVYLAWSLWALCVALTGVSVFFLALNVSNDAHIFDWWLGNVTVVIDVTVGAVVASRRPGNPVGWLLCFFGVAVGASSFSSQYAIYALLARGGSVPAGEAAAWVASWLLPVMIGLQVLYLVLFPTGRLPGRGWRWLVWATVGFVVVGATLAAFSPGSHLGSLGSIRNPLGVEGFTKFYEAVLFGSIFLFGAVASSLFARLRRAAGVERQQLKWLAYAAAAFAFASVLNVIVLAVDTPLWFEWVDLIIFTAVSPAIPVAIGIAILRYRLYDIDRIINRTLVYGALTATLALVYFVGVAGLQRLLAPLVGESSQLAIVASTLAIAALFNPLRRRIQDFMDRRFYRSKYDAAKTLEAFSKRLRDETDIEALGADLDRVVRETVQPAHVSVWLRHSEKAPLRGEVRS